MDDVNKQEHKSSFTNQDLEDKYKDFYIYKKETERKLANHESSLVNQEISLLKKITKLEEQLAVFYEKEEKVKNKIETLVNEKTVNEKPPQTENLEENYVSEDQNEEFAAKFIERQNLRKKELELISKEKQALSKTLSGIFSELN